MSAWIRVLHASKAQVQGCSGSRLAGAACCTPASALWWTCVRKESSLATLRKKTGYALNMCKKALQENQNDLSAAEKWLKEEAARHGWAKATKLQSRPAAEGLIGVFVDQNSSSSSPGVAVAVEVNCETDFVARNEIFRTLVSNITKTIASDESVQKNSSATSMDGGVGKYSLTEDQMASYKENLVQAVTHLGENIVLKRAILMQTAAGSPVRLIGYAHAVGGQPNTHNNILMGKYGTLLAYSEPAEEEDEDDSENRDEEQKSDKRAAAETEAREEEEREKSSTSSPPVSSSVEAASDAVTGTEEEAGKKAVTHAEEKEESGEVIAEYEEDSFEQIQFSTESLDKDQVAKLICQHIIGMKPLKIRETSEERKERRRLTQIRRQSGGGRDHQDEEEESEALLDQKFLLNQQVDVRHVLRDKDMRIVDFVRWECGMSHSDD